MRIHSDNLLYTVLRDAARVARVDMDLTRHGSRSRAEAFNVTLRGESNRAPNRGTAKGMDRFDRFDRPERAATWDQWGVFLGILFDYDPEMKTPYYKDREDFNFRTNNRFQGRSVVGQARTYIQVPQGGTRDFWPADAHGDHTFQYAGTPGRDKCTKCSAVRRWEIAS